MVRSMVPTVIRKEFREYRRNRFIVFTMAAMPVVVLLILVGETFALPERIPLAGKAIAAVLPAVAISWLLYAVYVGLAQLFAPAVVVSQIWTLDQVVAMAVLTPALAAFAILVGILISLRSTDFRVAQQLAVLASLPVIGLVALVTFRVIRPSAALYAAAAGAVGLMAAGCWRLATGLFKRERLLTRFGS